MHVDLASCSDSQKKIENGSGHVTGDAELADEVAGAADAEADAKAAAASGVATPAEGEVKEKKDAEASARPKRAEEEEEEDNTQSYAEYLAAKASAAIEGVAELTKRVVGEWTGEGEVVKKEGEDAFFAAKEKKERALKARKEKNTVRSQLDRCPSQQSQAADADDGLRPLCRSRSTASSPLRTSPPGPLPLAAAVAVPRVAVAAVVVPAALAAVPSVVVRPGPPPSPARRRPPRSTLPTSRPSRRSPKSRRDFARTPARPGRPLL